MTEKVRKNLGLLLIAALIAVVGLLARGAFGAIGDVVLLVAGIVGAVAVFEIATALMRDRDAPPPR